MRMENNDDFVQYILYLWKVVLFLLYIIHMSRVLYQITLADNHIILLVNQARNWEAYAIFLGREAGRTSWTWWVGRVARGGHSLDVAKWAWGPGPHRTRRGSTKSHWFGSAAWLHMGPGGRAQPATRVRSGCRAGTCWVAGADCAAWWPPGGASSAGGGTTGLGARARRKGALVLCLGPGLCQC